MKKMTKKALSLLLSVMMVVSMLPTFAISATAATSKKASDSAATQLKSAMTAYESKMNGTVYTNMAAAYTAYVNANKAYDAYVYGDSDVNLSTYTTNLTNATNAMSAWSAYNANGKTLIANKVFVDADNCTQDNYNNWYKNALYVQRGITANSNAAVNAAKMPSPDSGFSFDFKVFYPETTFLYDGKTTPTIGAMFSCYGNTKPWNWGWGNMYLYSVYINNTSDLTFNAKWKGTDERLNFSWIQATKGDLNISGTGDTTSMYYNQGKQKEQYYSNIMSFKKSLSTSDAMLIEYTPSFSARSGYNGNNGANSKLNTLGTGNRVIRVINYKKVVDTMSTNSSKINNVANYKQGGLATVIDGFDKATKDPNSFFTSSNNYDGCKTNYESACTNMAASATADDTKYQQLRDQMDASRATYDTDNACSLDSNNDKYTAETWTAFKEAYDNGKTIMAAPLNGSYNNGAGASAKAADILAKQNALTHKHHYNTATSLDNGTHQLACVVDGCTSPLGETVACSMSDPVYNVNTHNDDSTCSVCGYTTSTAHLFTITFVKNDNSESSAQFTYGTAASVVKESAPANSPSTDNGDGTHTNYSWTITNVGGDARIGETASDPEAHNSDNNWTKDEEASTDKLLVEVSHCTACGGAITKETEIKDTKYTVTYIDENGAQIGEVEEVYEGATPVGKGDAPDTCDDEGHHYFSWIDEEDNDVADVRKVVIDRDRTFTVKKTDVAHTYGEWTTYTAETCETDRVERQVCTVADDLGCKRYHERTVENTATGHAYGEWSHNANNTHTKTCANDASHKITETCEFEITNVVAAKCTVDGSRTYTCATCGYSYDEVIKQTGHNLDTEKNENFIRCTTDLQATSCTEAGSYDKVVRCLNANCTLDDHVYSRTTVPVPALGHDISSEFVPACVNNARYVTSCKRGDLTGQIVELYSADGIEANVIQPNVAYLNDSGKNGSSDSHKQLTYVLKDKDGNALTVEKMEVKVNVKLNSRNSRWSAYDGNTSTYAKANNGNDFKYSSTGERANEVATFKSNTMIIDYYFADNQDMFAITSIKVWVPDFQAKGSHQTTTIIENRVNCDENLQPTSCTQDGSYDEVVKCTRCGEIISRTNKTVTRLAHNWAYADNNDNTAGSFGTHKHYCTRCNTIDSTDTEHTFGQTIKEGNELKVVCSKCNSTQTVFTTTGKYRIMYNDLFMFDEFVDSIPGKEHSSYSQMIPDDNEQSITFIGKGENRTSNVNEAGTYHVDVTPGKSYTFEYTIDTNKERTVVFGVDENGENVRLYDTQRDWDHKTQGQNISYTMEIPAGVEQVYFVLGTWASSDTITGYATYSNMSFFEVGTYEVWDNLDAGTNILDTIGKEYGTADCCGWYTDKDFTNRISADDVLTANVDIYKKTTHNLAADWTTNGETEEKACADCGYVDVVDCTFTAKVTNDGDVYTWTDHCDVNSNHTKENKVVDISAYKAAVSDAEAEMTKTNVYTATSIAALKTWIEENAPDLTDASAITQDSLDDDITATIRTKTENLEKIIYTIKFTVADYETGDSIFESTQQGTWANSAETLVVPDEFKGEVVKWTLTYENNRVVRMSGADREMPAGFYGNYSYVCYIQSEKEATSEDKESHKITVLNTSKKIADVTYVEVSKEQAPTATISCDKENATITVNYDGETATLKIDKPAFYDISAFKIGSTTYKDVNAQIVLDSDVEIIPIYVASESGKITVKRANSNITFNGNDTNETFAWNERVTAKAADTTADTAWYVQALDNDGMPTGEKKLVGYGKSYSFYVTTSCVVSYENPTEEVAKEATVSVDYFNYDIHVEQAVMATASYSLPAGFKFVEAGMLLKTDRTTALQGSYAGNTYTGETTLDDNAWWETSITYANGKNGHYVADPAKITNTNQFAVKISRSATTSFVMGAVAYVKYIDNNGDEQIKFSDQQFIAYQQ